MGWHTPQHNWVAVEDFTQVNMLGKHINYYIYSLPIAGEIKGFIRD